MILAENVLKSRKAYGKYEKPIMRKLKTFFEADGYDVVPHARFNISWGSIISDIDLLLIKANKLTAIEVKSSRDCFSRACTQLENIRDYVDYLYVATEKSSASIEPNNIGIIEIHGNNIRIVRRARLIRDVPNEMGFALLHKICLIRLNGGDSGRLSAREGKYELATKATSLMDEKKQKSVLQQIIACGGNCSTGCPIFKFHHVTRLKSK